MYEIAQSIECEVSQWIPQNKDTWVFNVDDLKSQIKENTKLIVLNFPHNPTGNMLKMDAIKEIVIYAKEKGILIFSDEMYRFLNYDDVAMDSACDIADNVVSLFGMSKSYGLAGLRIGWLATQNHSLIEKFMRFKDYTTICSSAPSEILAIIGLRNGDSLVRRNRKLILDNLVLLDAFFSKYNDLFKWNRPVAGPIAFPELLLKKGVNEFCKEIVEKIGVMLLPSQVYSFSGNNFRIGFGRENMNEGLDVLDNYLMNKY